MKRMLTITVVAIVLISFLGLIGCGPKYASKETLDQLEEAKSACESVKSEVKSLEKQIEDLQNEKAAKEAKVAELEKRLEELKGE